MDTDKVYNISDYKKGVIYMRNDLILSLNKLNIVPLKIFELILSKVDPENPPEDNFVYVDRLEIVNFFEKDYLNRKYILQKYIEELQKETHFTVIENVDGYDVTKSIVPIPYAKWQDNEPKITFKLESEIMPYITDLKSNFTQYDLDEVRKLESKHAIILYRMLIMYYNQYLYYSKNKRKRKEQLDELKSPVMQISELRFMTDTEKKYKKYVDFKKRVLQPSVDEISEKTKINVDFKPIRVGINYVAIQFHISEKIIAKDAPETHPDFEEKEQKKQMKESEIYTQVMASKYTQLLLKTNLIDSNMLLDQKKMNELGIQVYPYYDQIFNIRGEEGVLHHMRYVKQNMAPLSDNEQFQQRQNGIVGYLRVCASQYVTRVETKNVELNNAAIQKDKILSLLDESYENDKLPEAIYKVFRDDIENNDSEDEESDEIEKEALEKRYEEIRQMIESLNTQV